MTQRINRPSDLAALRDKARAEMTARSGAGETAVIVHMGTCGIASGAREVMSSFVASLSEAGVESVAMKQSGCLGLCDKEPMATLTDSSGASYVYGRLNATKVREIVQGHVLGGSPVAEHLIQSEGGAKKHGQR